MPTSGIVTRQREHFYLVRVQRHDVDVSGWDDLERIFLGEHRWWTLGEIEASADDFAPSRLAHFLADTLTGRVSNEPLDTGI
jgi:hypothetical protein